MRAFPMAHGASGAGGALVRMAGMSPGAGALVHFGCDDCAVEAARAAAAGGRVERPTFPIGPYGHVALFVDPEGNTIGLHSMA